MLLLLPCRQSLDLDLAEYQGKSLSALQHLKPMVDVMMSNSSKPFGRTRGTLKLVLIVNNTLLQPDNKQDIYQCERPCYHQVRVAGHRGGRRRSSQGHSSIGTHGVSCRTAKRCAHCTSQCTATTGRPGHPSVHCDTPYALHCCSTHAQLRRLASTSCVGGGTHWTTGTTCCSCTSTCLHSPLSDFNMPITRAHVLPC